METNDGNTDGFIAGNSDGVTIHNCIMHNNDSPTNGTKYGIYIYSATGTNWTIYNCIVANIDSGSSASYGIRSVAVGTLIYNCTVYNMISSGSSGYCYVPMNTATTSDRTTAINCAGFYNDVSVDFYQSGNYQFHANSSNNCSSDATAPGSDSLTNKTDTDNFYDLTADSENLHCKDTNADIHDAGTDLSGTFTNDIDDETRSYWSIGADDIFDKSLWLCYKTITINNAEVAGSADLEDFVIYIGLASDAQLASNAQADGDDIIFFDTDNQTRLYHELVSYTSVSGALACFVRIPVLDFDNNTVIYMYYNNSGCSAQENTLRCWQGSGYKDVYHLEEDPNGDGLLMYESVSDAIEGTIKGTMTSGDLVSGKLGNCLDFDGSDDGMQFYIPSGGFYQISWSDRTMECWVNSTGTGSGPKIQIDWGNSTNGWCILYRTSPDQYCVSTEESGAKAEAQSTSTDAEDGTLYYIAGVFDCDNSNGNFTGNNFGIYFNGSLEDEDTQACPITGDVENPGAGIGDKYGTNPHTSCYPHLGKIDEVRISEGSRTSAFILTNYNNQNRPGDFITLGSQVCAGPTLTPTISATPTQTITATPTQTQTPTLTATLSATPTQTLTATLSATLSQTATLTNTPTQTNTQTPTLTISPTATATLTATQTQTGVATATPTATPTFTLPLNMIEIDCYRYDPYIEMSAYRYYPYVEIPVYRYDPYIEIPVYSLGRR